MRLGRIGLEQCRRLPRRRHECPGCCVTTSWSERSGSPRRPSPNGWPGSGPRPVRHRRSWMCRSEAEHAGGHIAGSLNIPLRASRRADRVRFPAGRPVAVHCEGGYRSADRRQPPARSSAAVTCYDMVGGYKAWLAAKHPRDPGGVGGDRPQPQVLGPLSSPHLRGRWRSAPSSPEVSYVIDNRRTPATDSYPELLVRLGATERFEWRLGFNYERGSGGSIVTAIEGGEGIEGDEVATESTVLYGCKALVSEQDGWGLTDDAAAYYVDSGIGWRF